MNESNNRAADAARDAADMWNLLTTEQRHELWMRNPQRAQALHDAAHGIVPDAPMTESEQDDAEMWALLTTAERAALWARDETKARSMLAAAERMAATR